ncbi:MAG: hypothetical protein HW380_373 [Magnetococcales bacterium]|nr:hypothetical protein [Magnetococcales bacterium]
MDAVYVLEKKMLCKSGDSKSGDSMSISLSLFSELASDLADFGCS